MPKKYVKIGNKIIGPDQPVFIIAEAGVNHNGRLDLALQMVDAAKEAGADAIKFQTFKAEQVVTGKGKMAEYQKKNIGKEESQLAMLKKLELPENFYSHIIKRCQQKKIIFFSAAHGSFDSVDFLYDLNVPAFKFGSGDLNNLPVLEYAAKFKKPIILGTGMATMKEVKEAVACIRKTGNDKVIVLHATSNYPCPLDEINLAAMQTMIKELDVLVGYSDHTTSVIVPALAYILGACLIEKHFTLDKKLSGPDHKASVDVQELKEMVQNIRNVAVIMGSDIKQPNKSELKIMKNVKKSVVSKKFIPAGKIIGRDDLEIKRPAGGLQPRFFYEIIGKKAKRDLPAGELIKKTDYGK